MYVKYYWYMYILIVIRNRNKKTVLNRKINLKKKTHLPEIQTTDPENYSLPPYTLGYIECLYFVIILNVVPKYTCILCLLFTSLPIFCESHCKCQILHFFIVYSWRVGFLLFCFILLLSSQGNSNLADV